MLFPLSAAARFPRWLNALYETVIFPVVLCGYEAWSLTLREELRVRVYENNVLRRIFGSKR
jgi:hypothetical protein